MGAVVMERSAIVDECIALIAPDAQHGTECRWRIENDINVLCWLNTPKIESPSELLEEVNEEDRRECFFALMEMKLTPTRADREALRRFAEALMDALTALSEARCVHYLSVLLPAFNAAKFSKELLRPIIAAKHAARGMRLKDGKPFNKLKLDAACFANQLIEDFGTKPPTLTIGGPYYELASVLYGAATGEHEADLSRQCKAFLHIRRQRSTKDE